MTTTSVGTGRLRPVTVALWIGQGLLALQFAIGGAAKLAGTQAMVDMFADIAAGQWLRFLVGTLEVVGAAGLMLPRWCGLSALGLAGLMTGAAFTNPVVLGDSPLVPSAIGIVAAAIALARRHEIQDLTTRASLVVSATNNNGRQQ